VIAASRWRSVGTASPTGGPSVPRPAPSALGGVGG